MRKKSLWVFLAALIIVVASAIFLFLQSSSPEHSVKQFFKSFKTQDKESMRHVYTADILSIAQNSLEAAVASGIDASIEQDSTSAEDLPKEQERATAEDLQKEQGHASVEDLQKEQERATAENLPKEQERASEEDLPKEQELASEEDLPKEDLSPNATNDQTEASKERSAKEKHDNKAKEKYDSKAIVSEAQKKILDFEYDIKSSEISGNQANVVVEITSYELGKAYREWYLESRQIKFSDEGSSGRKNIDLRLNLLEQKFKESTKTYKSVFEIKLIKKHGDWLISDMGDSYEFLRAVSGAFIYS